MDVSVMGKQGENGCMKGSNIAATNKIAHVKDYGEEENIRSCLVEGFLRHLYE